MASLKPGLYDLLVSQEVGAKLDAMSPELRRVAELSPDESHELIARAIQALKSIGGKDRIQKQTALANEILTLLARDAERGTTKGDALPASPEHLLAILESAEGPARPREPERPAIPLASSDLLVNSRHDLSLGPELKRELDSADEVDLLCSFVKWSGFRVVEERLRELLARKPGSVRVLTTTYMGATQRRALDELQGMGAQVRVSYDESRTRLHAKAWLFHRESGFSTGFVGSSNLSAPAILDGLEWNVRLSQVDNGAILDKLRAAFRQYWADPEFRTYDPAEFDDALERRETKRHAHFFQFELFPRPHQQQILDDLEAERDYGHWHNLVVAATGTGKTVVAALDYKRLRTQLERSRLLFVAHRKEILQQSLTTFQVALSDGSFGEMLRGGEQPVRWEHVFASVQSLTGDRLDQVDPSHFDVIIVDEFHHAAAKTYDDLLSRMKPRVLLGLTATPERTDGQSILHWFGDRIASEPDDQEADIGKDCGDLWDELCALAGRLIGDAEHEWAACYK